MTRTGTAFDRVPTVLSAHVAAANVAARRDRLARRCLAGLLAGSAAAAPVVPTLDLDAPRSDADIGVFAQCADRAAVGGAWAPAASSGGVARRFDWAGGR